MQSCDVVAFISENNPAIEVNKCGERDEDEDVGAEIDR